MSQSQQTSNSHIGTYLDYYCNLPHAPGFAVLLQGEWGSGKTWFINKYREKLKEKNHKCLYISLYGMTNFSEIEDAFFQQLHPLLASKGMAVTGKILKGLLKGTLKIDLNNDSRDEGAVNLQIPEINLPDYLKNVDRSILIFDDLERCNIDLVNVLGYINSFVEHQDLKAILIANEDELAKKDDRYKIIKEKLIGKTFGISLDFEGALENFITMVSGSDIKKFLSNNAELIQDLYAKAEYKNLRNLKQIVLDFERIFDALPEKAKNNLELLQDLLKLLMVFSIEIKRGNMRPKDISKLEDVYTSRMSKRISRQSLNSNERVNHEEPNPLEKVLETYSWLNLYEPFPSNLWWQAFFDKGIIDTDELDQSISNSKYFQDGNTPNWIRLWHFRDISDDEFDSILNSVELDYNNRKYVEIGEIKHVFGLFLQFSDARLYKKSKDEILRDAKHYIDYLKDSKQLTLTAPSLIDSITDDAYGSLGFCGKEFEEFQELSLYIDEVRELAQEENLPAAGKDLLTIMQSDKLKFSRMISVSRYQYEDVLTQKYHDIPILNYVEPHTFIAALLSMNDEDQRYIFWALSERYKFENVPATLIEELAWLKSVQNSLQSEVENRKGKISGFVLNLNLQYYLDKIVKKLEKKKSQIQAHQ
ncbi:MAG: KAP family NTPase [Myxacorys chilensis ATA2-1-KO14]|jgi:hypothetical protein|nr:KAP family NTPase [Myxacorys chilensis ATA2-1-KO14]